MLGAPALQLRSMEMTGDNTEEEEEREEKLLMQSVVQYDRKKESPFILVGGEFRKKMMRAPYRMVQLRMKEKGKLFPSFRESSLVQGS